MGSVTIALVWVCCFVTYLRRGGDAKYEESPCQPRFHPGYGALHEPSLGILESPVRPFPD